MVRRVPPPGAAEEGVTKKTSGPRSRQALAEAPEESAAWGIRGSGFRV